MQTVKVVTCSAACVPPGVASHLDITIIPFTLVVDGGEYRDGVDMSTEEFYSILAAGEADVSTATPTTGAYLDAFKILAGTCDSVFCATIATRFSAAHLAASSAAALIDSVEVEVFDSRTAATAEGQVAIAAARAAREGLGLEEVRAAAEAVAGSAELYAAVETFEYLRRSGRMGPAAALVADALNIKPVFRLADGDLKPVSRSFSKKRALDRMVREAETAARARGPLHMAFFHASAPEEVKAFRERTLGAVPHQEHFTSDFTPVMGRHTGPGIVGLSFY